MSFLHSLQFSIAKFVLGEKIARAFYEGADRSTNRDFKPANTPFEYTANSDRATLVSRARWLHENNGIMANIDNAIVDNTVGASGMKLKMKTGDKAVNRAIEKKFEQWSNGFFCDVTGRLDFGAMQRMILGQRMMDGEILLLKNYTGNMNHPFSIQLIETDRLNSLSPTASFYRDENFIDGITVDTRGKPTHYHFTSHFGTKNETIEAKNIIHYFKQPNRVTQYRGLTEYRQAIVDLRNFAGYQSAVIKSARSRANVAYAVETPDAFGHARGHQPYADTATADPLYDINGVIVEYLRPGEKIHQLDPSIVGMDYPAFVTASVRLIAVARQISYELAFRDYSHVNFASARASLIQDNKRFDAEQIHIVSNATRPITQAWLEANILAGNIKGVSPDGYYRNRDDFKDFWIPPKRDWVDPLKDIRAFEMELGLNATTLEAYLASKGLDLEDVIEDRKAEIQKLRDAGILDEKEPN